MGKKRISGSFRDPSGFLFTKDGIIYRQVNKIFKDDYDRLMTSGLYDDLVNSHLLIPHEEVEADGMDEEIAYKILKPEQIHFISYPYEWCFSQLKDAALATIKIQKTAMAFGMSLKDSSAYNIQFLKGKPIFIDTLSFEAYQEGKPWIAYKQFCQHFLAPLSLMSYRDIRLSQLLRIYMDGIPIDLCSSLLPPRTLLSFPLLIHIHLQSGSQKYFSSKVAEVDRKKISKTSLQGLIDSLESAIRGLTLHNRRKMSDRCKDTNLTAENLTDSQKIVTMFLEVAEPELIWDLRAETGPFVRTISGNGISTISFNTDPFNVERNYLKLKETNETNVLPLLQDLTNPSSAIGWANRERMSFLERGPADAILALGLVHHLVISNNLSFGMIAEFFNDICGRYLIIEFMPKSDSQVQMLLANRKDIFGDYTKEVFEKCFKIWFMIERSERIENTERLIYLMKKKMT